MLEPSHFVDQVGPWKQLAILHCSSSFGGQNDPKVAVIKLKIDFPARGFGSACCGFDYYRLGTKCAKKLLKLVPSAAGTAMSDEYLESGNGFNVAIFVRPCAVFLPHFK